LTKYDSFRISSGSTFSAILGIVALLLKLVSRALHQQTLSSDKKVPAA